MPEQERKRQVEGKTEKERERERGPLQQVDCNLFRSGFLRNGGYLHTKSDVGDIATSRRAASVKFTEVIGETRSLSLEK